MFKAIKYILVIVVTLPLCKPVAGQMLVPGQIKQESLNNCIVYHLRQLDQYESSGDLIKECQAPGGWSPDAHEAIFLFPAVSSLYSAEIAYCGSPGCASSGGDVRLVLVGAPLPNAYIVKPPEGSSSLTIVVTTALVDFILRSAHALLTDYLEEPNRGRDGFDAWLDSIRVLGGKACSEPARWNSTKLSEKVNEDILQRTATSVLMFIFAHELAHRLRNQTCGYKNDPALRPEENALGVEKACDKVALTQLNQAGLSFPLFVIGTFMSWQHYITLKSPKLTSEYPGGLRAFKTSFPGLALKERAMEIIAEWEGVCNRGSNAPLCRQDWKAIVAAARRIANSSAPAPCKP